jgi:hypothetical protein
VAPSASAQAAAVRALLQLPSNCLTVRGGRGKHRRILRRLKDAAEQDDPLPVLDDQSPRPPRRAVAAPADPSRVYNLAARVHSQVQSGNISGVANCLDSLPLAEVAPQVMQEMHNLHPYSAPPPHIAIEAPTLNLTEEDFDAVLDNLGVGKAPGLTGWTYEHIKQLCSWRTGKQASLTLVNALLSGQLPPLFDAPGLRRSPPAQANRGYSPHCHERGMNSTSLPLRSAQVQ